MTKKGSKKGAENATKNPKEVTKIRVAEENQKEHNEKRMRTWFIKHTTKNAEIEDKEIRKMLQQRVTEKNKLTKKATKSDKKSRLKKTKTTEKGQNNARKKDDNQGC